MEKVVTFMTPVTAYAYPRAALIGNPSDGYYGKTISFVFSNYHAFATVEESEKLCIVPGARDVNEFDGLEEFAEHTGSFGYYGGLRLLKAALSRFWFHCRKHNIRLPKRNFSLSYGSDIPNQLGLAGSSAIITAALRAVCTFFGVEIADAEFANVVLAAEKEELHIPAGLQDRVAQAYNFPVFMDFDRSRMEIFGYGRYEEVPLPPELNIFIAYRTDLAEGSEILHSRLRADYNAGKVEVLAAVKEWAQLTDKCRKCLISGDLTEIPSLINRNFDLRLEVCADSISEGNLRMVQIARSCGASAKFTGSGGAIIGTYSDDTMFENMRKAFRAEHIDLLKPDIVCEGNI